MFDLEFAKAEKINGGWKKTICRILRVYNIRGRQRTEVVSEGVAFWNDESDKYDLETGKYEALKKAYLALPNSAKVEFNEWAGL